MREVLLLFGGVQVVITSLVAFLGKIWLDRSARKHQGEIDAQLQRLRSESAERQRSLQHALDRELQVHALHYAKELGVYETIWSSLIDLAKAALQLRPAFDYHDPNQTEDERKNARLKQLWEAGQSYLDQVNKERPFFSKDVYSSLMALQKTIRKESIEYQYGDHVMHREYWENALENANRIQSQIDDACEAIRQRLGTISVTG